MDKFVIKTKIPLLHQLNVNAIKVQDIDQKIEQIEVSTLIDDPNSGLQF